MLSYLMIQKRKAFESVIDQGAFSFDVDGKIKNIQHSSELSEKALNSFMART